MKPAIISNENKQLRNNFGLPINSDFDQNKLPPIGKERYLTYQVSESKKDFSESTNNSSNNDEKNSLISSNWDKGLRFLVVDDTITNRKMTRRMLSSLGHSVDEAADGLEFLAKLNIDNGKSLSSDQIPFKSGCYDVVLMDDNMPNMSGPVATKIARANGYQGLIFGVTGNAHFDQIENFLQSGANEIFEKPLNIDKLKLSIERLLIKM
jgi:CheY-like chemotaxis protein